MRKILVLSLTIFCLLLLFGCANKIEQLDDNQVENTTENIETATSPTEQEPTEIEDITNTIDQNIQENENPIEMELSVKKVLTKAYNNLTQDCIIHITGNRLKINNENTYVETLNNKNRNDYELWLNNQTNEFLKFESNIEFGNTESLLRRFSTHEDIDYEYSYYYCSWNIDNEAITKNYELNKVGYKNILCENIHILPMIDRFFMFEESDDEDCYLITSDSIIYKTFSQSPMVVKVKISKDELLINKIELLHEDYIEIINIEYYGNEDRSIFYDQFPKEAYSEKVDGVCNYKNKSECEEPFFIIPYEQIKMIFDLKLFTENLKYEDIFQAFINEDQ